MTGSPAIGTLDLRLPLKIRQAGECFEIRDAAGRSVAYFYFEDQEQRRSVMRRLTREQAQACAQATARALTEAVQNAEKAPPA